MSSSIVRLSALGGMAVGMMFLTGCASYYKVEDPTTGKTYYTEKVDDKGGGAVKFTDSRSETEVTLQNSHVEKLSKAEYEEGMRMQAAMSAEKSAAPTSSTPPGMAK